MPLEEVGAAHPFAEVAPELLLRSHEQHVAVGGLVDLVADPVAHARRARRPPLVPVGGVAGDLVLGPLVGLPGLAAQPVHRRGGVGLGDLEAARLARGPGPGDAGEDPERTEDRPGVDPDRGVLGDGAVPVLGHLGGDEPGPDVVGDAVAGEVLVGAGHPVPRQRAEHDPGVHRPARLVADPSPLEAAGAHRLDHGVSAAHQLEEHLPAGVGAQVDRDRALPPADVEVHERDALHDRPGHLADVVPRGRLDLDDVGAQIGEGGGDGAGTEHRALDDPDALERRGQQTSSVQRGELALGVISPHERMGRSAIGRGSWHTI